MLIKKGKNRIVLIFPALGFALKFPNIHFIRAARQLFTYGFHNPFPGEINRSLTEHLFKGIGDNWREFRFYFTRHHPFCLPTYFSLFGLCNIQRAGKPCRLGMQELWNEIHSITAGEAFQDAHHFSNPLNFCHVGNHLKILDYGHLKTQEIIEKFGSQLYQCKHGVCLASSHI